MTEHYLPVRESLGYKNVRKALKTVFSIDLDKLPIREGEYENFAFDLTYNSIPTIVVVAATGNIVTDGYVRIEFQTDQTEYIDIPFGNQDGTNLDPDPASGNGFIKSEKYTIPKYKVVNPEQQRPSVQLKDGSRMYLNIDGDEILVGVVKNGKFIYLGG